MALVSSEISTISKRKKTGTTKLLKAGQPILVSALSRCCEAEMEE